MKIPKTLVAEDDPNDALLLHRAFQQAGVSSAVDFVSDGLDVVDYLRGKELSDVAVSATLPNLLLLNLNMPGLDGFGVLEWLREHHHLRPARVVVFSTSQAPEDMDKARALGADDYLVKSHDWGNLASTLGRVLAF